jgi:catechol 2,3-dioxygenase-like lactoylglutathione lyase family enzyme
MENGLLVLAAASLSFVLGMALQSARGSAADAPPRATGIGGVFFKAKEPAKLGAWYREHLGIGLEAAGEGPNAMQYGTFQWREKDHADTVGSTVFSIFPASSKYFGTGDAPFMITFRVANLDRLLAQLKAEGVPVDAKIEDEANGRFGWITDPEGHRIELWEPKGE